jgi:hypothetical protein
VSRSRGYLSFGIGNCPSLPWHIRSESTPSSCVEVAVAPTRKWRWRGNSGDSGGAADVAAVDLVAELPTAGSAPSIGLGLGVGCGDWGEPHGLYPGPHFLFIYSTGRRGPTSQWTAEYPRSGHGQGVRLVRWVETGEINPNILPLDLLLYFNL